MARPTSHDTRGGSIVPNGCSLHPDCFECPEKPDCVYPGEAAEWVAVHREQQRQARDAEVLRLLKEGLTYEQIAEKLGISERTISRIMVRWFDEAHHKRDSP